jgi:hypothetical protein
MSRAEYEAMPAQITVRELRIRVKEKTKRVRGLDHRFGHPALDA